MIRNTETTQTRGKANTQQTVGKTSTTNKQQPGNTTLQAGSQRSQPDQERAIETRRDADRSSSVSRRPQFSEVRGTTASPFWLMSRMAEDMDHMLQELGVGDGLGQSAFSTDRSSGGSSLERAFWSPQVETFRRGDKLVVRADLPGLKKEDVKVEIDNDILTISGERTDEHEENRDGYFSSERSYGQFYRAVQLPDGVSSHQCEASFKDGVLEVTLGAPKEQERKAKQIQVR
jgi:HSP20 family protein